MRRFRISDVMLLVIRSRWWFGGKTEDGIRRRETAPNGDGVEASADLAWAGYERLAPTGRGCLCVAIYLRRRRMSNTPNPPIRAATFGSGITVMVTKLLPVKSPV